MEVVLKYSAKNQGRTKEEKLIIVDQMVQDIKSKIEELKSKKNSTPQVKDVPMFGSPSNVMSGKFRKFTRTT